MKHVWLPGKLEDEPVPPRNAFPICLRTEDVPWADLLNACVQAGAIAEPFPVVPADHARIGELGPWIQRGALRNATWASRWGIVLRSGDPARVAQAMTDILR